MTLAEDLSGFIHALRLGDVGGATVDQAKTLVLDALACMIAGADADGAAIALQGIRAPHPDGTATIAVHGLRAQAADAALVNGAMLRGLDMMDTYVSQPGAAD